MKPTGVEWTLNNQAWHQACKWTCENGGQPFTNGSHGCITCDAAKTCQKGEYLPSCTGANTCQRCTQYGQITSNALAYFIDGGISLAFT
jgi:hypothetical protein